MAANSTQSSSPTVALCRALKNMTGGSFVEIVQFAIALPADDEVDHKQLTKDLFDNENDWSEEWLVAAAEGQGACANLQDSVEMLSSGTGALAAAFRCTFMILGKKKVNNRSIPTTYHIETESSWLSLSTLKQCAISQLERNVNAEFGEVDDALYLGAGVVVLPTNGEDGWASVMVEEEAGEDQSLGLLLTGVIYEQDAEYVVMTRDSFDDPWTCHSASGAHRAETIHLGCVKALLYSILRPSVFVE